MMEGHKGEGKTGKTGGEDGAVIRGRWRTWR